MYHYSHQIRVASSEIGNSHHFCKLSSCPEVQEASDSLRLNCLLVHHRQSLLPLFFAHSPHLFFAHSHHASLIENTTSSSSLIPWKRPCHAASDSTRLHGLLVHHHHSRLMFGGHSHHASLIPWRWSCHARRIYAARSQKSFLIFKGIQCSCAPTTIGTHVGSLHGVGVPCRSISIVR